ncbi:MAG TPA: GIY-YIG nuclease family protein [Polyangia bacterium]|nr:GIY-YIG nuclease family protein [Polyangia bacterium]
MRTWIAIVALIALVPTGARAERRLHGRFEAQPVEGVNEWYRFHRDATYEWMQELSGPNRTLHRWACGRYVLEGKTLILREDPSEHSCKRAGTPPHHGLIEHWVLAQRLHKQAVVLGGAAYARAQSDAPPRMLTAAAH